VWGAVAAGAVAAAKAASDLEQATGAVGQVFGEQAPQIMAWAEGMAQYGLSTAQAAQAAAVLGAQLANAGIPMEATAQLTEQLIMLGADMAAVFGGTVPQAVGALGAALRGEYDSLERYGITLTADAVAAEAAALSAQGLTFASEQQAKVVATLALIQQQATAITGAAAEEQDTLAASTQQLKAQITNLAAELGGVLSPVLAGVIGATADLIGAFTTAISESGILTSAANVLATAFNAVWSIVEPVLVPALEALQSIMDRLANFLDAYVIPVLDRLAEAFQRVADAISVVIGWVQDAIGWFESLIGTIHEAIDALTFWNDTYQASTTAAIATTAAQPRAGGALPAPAAAGTTINIQMGVGDPHAVAREIRRVLRLDAARMGRPL
jgi:hypothetical protein